MSAQLALKVTTAVGVAPPSQGHVLLDIIVRQGVLRQQPTHAPPGHTRQARRFMPRASVRTVLQVTIVSQAPVHILHVQLGAIPLLPRHKVRGRLLIQHAPHALQGKFHNNIFFQMVILMRTVNNTTLNLFLFSQTVISAHRVRQALWLAVLGIILREVCQLVPYVQPATTVGATQLPTPV